MSSLQLIILCNVLFVFDFTETTGNKKKKGRKRKELSEEDKKSKVRFFNSFLKQVVHLCYLCYSWLNALFHNLIQTQEI